MGVHTGATRGSGERVGIGLVPDLYTIKEYGIFSHSPISLSHPQADMRGGGAEVEPVHRIGTPQVAKQFFYPVEALEELSTYVVTQRCDSHSTLRNYIPQSHTVDSSHSIQVFQLYHKSVVYRGLIALNRWIVH